MPTLEPWEPTNVTIMGDAIHNMSPMGGKVANTALRDAETVTHWLVDAPAEQAVCNRDVRGYEEEMRHYANDAMKVSKHNAMNAIDV